VKRRNAGRVARIAGELAVELHARLPPGCAPRPVDLVEFTWPLALRLVRLELRARGDRKAAKRYRDLRRGVEALMAAPAAVADSAAPLAALARSVPLDARHWHTELAAGAPAVRYREPEAA
jgi:hypothetical protein